MTRLHFCVVLFVASVLGLSLMVPAEDVPETAYDESEALLYESTPSFSFAGAMPIGEEATLRWHAFRPGRAAFAQSTHGSARKSGSSPRLSRLLTILDHSFRC